MAKSKVSVAIMRGHSSASSPPQESWNGFVLPVEMGNTDCTGGVSFTFQAQKCNEEIQEHLSNCTPCLSLTTRSTASSSVQIQCNRYALNSILLTFVIIKPLADGSLIIIFN